MAKGYVRAGWRDGQGLTLERTEGATRGKPLAVRAVDGWLEDFTVGKTPAIPDSDMIILVLLGAGAFVQFGSLDSVFRQACVALTPRNAANVPMIATDVIAPCP